MAESKMKTSWIQTSGIMAILVNINKDPKKGQSLPLDYFSPFKEKADRVQQSKMGFAALKEMCVKKKKDKK